MRLGTRLLTVLATVLLVVAPQVPASADPPANDAVTHARALGMAPRTFSIDTTEATASSNDGSCVGGASVWFRISPKVTRVVRLSTLGSDYDTLVGVFRGPRSSRRLIACLDDTFGSATEARGFRFVAGQTYWVAVSACCDRTSRGGHLALRTWLPTPAGVTATVDSVRSGAVSGRLVVRGTAECATPSELWVSAYASQRVNAGTNVARGGSEGYATCLPGQPTSWTVRLDSDTGWAFQAGQIAMTVDGGAYDGFQFAPFDEPTETWTVTEDAAARAR